MAHQPFSVGRSRCIRAPPDVNRTTDWAALFSGFVELSARTCYSGCKIARLDPLDTSRRHILPSLRQRTIYVDGATSILHDVGRQAGLAGIDRRPGNAEVGGKTRNKDRVDASLLEIARQPGMGLSVGLYKCRVPSTSLRKPLRMIKLA
jgi:hypothetical protein